MKGFRTAVFGGRFGVVIASGVFLAAVLAGGCATPIGTRAVGVHRVWREVNESALDGKRCSASTTAVLHRYNILAEADGDPVRATALLHGHLDGTDRSDVLFALAEYCYLQGEKADSLWGRLGWGKDNPEWHLAAVLYAYWFLTEAGDGGVSPFDRRYRMACDLYNTGLARGLATDRSGTLELAGGERPLPVGSLSLVADTSGFSRAQETGGTVVAADYLSVYGLSHRIRDPGLGAPVVVIEKKNATVPVPRRVPGTVFLRPSAGPESLPAGVSAGLLLLSPDSTPAVEIGGETLPVEADLTVAMANQLRDPFLWKLGMRQFLTGKQLIPNGVYLTRPHRPGRIPVVLVHGTMSSPVPFAEMMNTLRADPVLRRRTEVWLFTYDSGKPVFLSVLQLREALTGMVEKLDPAGKDPALRNMVVIGHSQGGLLTKGVATNTGDALVKAYEESADWNPFRFFSAADRALVAEAVELEALPCVGRVVFIATPHRGSFLARSGVRNLARKFINLPRNMVQTTTRTSSALMQLDFAGALPASLFRTSLDGMSPANPGLLAIAEIPVDPRIPAHSIIAVKNREGDPHGGNDGVVAYESAHVDYVESEFIVRSGHSCQEEPVVIEEVRRILLKHAAAAGPPTPAE